MDKRREKPAQNKEQAILDAAEREFLAKGFDGARTTSIAEAAGVTHAMLHYYFRTKENIFERILDQKMHLMGESVLTAFGQSGKPVLERIRDGIARHFDFIADNPELPRFIVNEVMSRPERYGAMQRRIAQVIDRMVCELQHELDASAARGQTERMDVRMLMLDIVSLNVFAFIAMPIIQPLIGGLAADRAEFYELRKEENIEVVMRRLKKS